MNSVCYTLGAILLVATCAVGVPLSENVDQVPPPVTPDTTATPSKDNGSTDFTPPPAAVRDNHVTGHTIPAQASSYDSSMYPGLLPGSIPPYPDPYPGTYPSSYPPPGSYVPQPGYPTQYVVQTGYEGYLVPSTAAQPTQVSDPYAFLRGVIPAPMINWIVRTMAVIMGTVTIVFMGGAVTAAVCSLTPFCSLSFKSLSVFNWNDTAKSVGRMLGDEITTERVKRTADFVKIAIKKYSQLQKALNLEEFAEAN